MPDAGGAAATDGQFLKKVGDVDVFVAPDGRFSALVAGKRRHFRTLREVEKALEGPPGPVRAFSTGWRHRVTEHQVVRAVKRTYGHLYYTETGERLESAYLWDEGVVAELRAIEAERAALDDRVRAVLGRATALTPGHLTAAGAAAKGDDDA